MSKNSQKGEFFWQYASRGFLKGLLVDAFADGQARRLVKCPDSLIGTTSQGKETMDNQSDFLDLWDDLTPREKEAFCLLVEGESDKEIAKKLYLSVRTVGIHVHNILKKFGKQSRMSLVAYYYRDSGYLIIKEGEQHGIRKTA